MDIVRNTTAGVAVAASLTDKVVSNRWRPKDRMQALVTIVLSDVVRATGITFKLKDSADGGATFADVGTESEVAVAAAKTAASATDVNATSNVITSSTHGFVTGQPVIYKEGSVAIAGLTTSTTYWVIKVTADTFKLALSYDDAMAGTAIDITSTGTGTQSFYKAVYEIRMIKEDSTDLAQLPLQEFVQVVVSSGSGDSCTVSAVHVPET